MQGPPPCWTIPPQPAPGGYRIPLSAEASPKTHPAQRGHAVPFAARAHSWPPALGAHGVYLTSGTHPSKQLWGRCRVPLATRASPQAPRGHRVPLTAGVFQLRQTQPGGMQGPLTAGASPSQALLAPGHRRGPSPHWGSPAQLQGSWHGPLHSPAPPTPPLAVCGVPPKRGAPRPGPAQPSPYLRLRSLTTMRVMLWMHCVR